MSDLVYLQSNGRIYAQIWHGPPFIGAKDGMAQILRRIRIEDDEVHLAITTLMAKYPLEDK